MSIHKPVLLKETIELLNLKPGMTVVDATLGGGGHSREVLKIIGETGILIAFDLDIEAVKNFAEFSIFNFQFSNNFKIPIFKFQNKILVNDNFASLSKVLEILKIEKVDAVLADLGWSSDQLIGKGMSFMVDERLDMRLDRGQELTAEKVVNEYERKDLERVLRDYGEEKFWRGIARKIIEYRKKKKIETTGELAEIIKNATPPKYRFGKTNPATQTFQALRIETNKELGNLENFIPQAIKSLSSGGRLAIISFHSLEDRIVKNIFRENARGCICPPAMRLQKTQEKLLKNPENENLKNEMEMALRAGPKDFPQCVCGKSPVVSIVTRKPIGPDPEETAQNPRARSAKLRVCEKI